MAGKYLAYPEYKDSGVEMLGALPVNWQTKQVRYLLKDGAEGIRIGPFGSALKLEDMVNTGTRVYGQENVIKKDFSLGKRRISETKFERMQVYQVYTNDLLITMMGTSGKCELVPEGAEIGIIDSHLLRLRVKEAEVFPRFFRLLIDECYEIENQIKISGKGSIMHGLNSSIVKSLTLPLPTPVEQEVILNFLDHETAKIDTLIDKQQQLIKLLKEKRQAVISHAVTKGLNPNVPMRNSGVEWLGEVPEHWRETEIRYITKQMGGGTPSKERADFWKGNIPWVSPKDMKIDYIDDAQDKITSQAVLESSTKLIPAGSVLIVVRGMILIHSVPVALTKKELTINQDMKALIPAKEIDGEFLLFFMKGLRDFILDLVEESAHGTKCLRSEVFERMKIAIPEIEEQIEIVIELKRKTSLVDTLIEKATCGIELLSERRVALISAAVTGKIDVRNWKAPAKDSAI